MYKSAADHNRKYGKVTQQDKLNIGPPLPQPEDRKCTGEDAPDGCTFFNCTVGTSVCSEVGISIYAAVR